MALVRQHPKCSVLGPPLQERHQGPGACPEKEMELRGIWSTVLWGAAEGNGMFYMEEAQGRPHHSLQGEVVESQSLKVFGKHRDVAPKDMVSGHGGDRWGLNLVILEVFSKPQ